jgi:Tol biopolymer transport system component
VTTAPRGKVDLPGDYAPDNSTIIFKRTVEEADGPLLVVPVGGGTARPLSSAVYEDPGRYSPDGSQIITSIAGDLVLLNTAGKEIRRVHKDARYLFGADWSPDGSHIAFSSAFGGPFADIVISLPDGTDRHTITGTHDNEIAISWGRAG